MSKRFLFLGTWEDKPYLDFLKILLKGHKCYYDLNTPSTVAEIAYKANKNDLDGIICANEAWLNKLINDEERATLSNYAGSIIDITFPNIKPVECLVLNPLAQLYTVRYGQFITKRFLTKFTQPEKWNDPLKNFSYELATPRGLESFYDELSNARFLGCDTETLRSNLSIHLCGYTLVNRDFSHRTIVLNVNSGYDLAWIRKINEHPIPKLFQNGSYDCAYFLRFGCPPRNYFYDTLHLFHSWLAELPKSLGFVTSFALRKWPFWKDLAKSGNFETQVEYNARDCFGMCAAWIQLIRECPPWALKNYAEFEFPMIFPSLYCSMEGWKIDLEERKRLKEKEEQRLLDEDKALAVMAATPGFNANSPKQVGQLLQLIRVPVDKKGANVITDEKHLKKYKFANPLAGRFVTRILDRREAKKAVSTYFKDEGWGIGDRFLYSISAALTDTGRLASREHPFWVGANCQNIPEYAKSMYIADDGYLLAEPDFEQSEARCVAYESQDENLIATVESGKDYHAVNVERFFGIAYEQIVNPDGKVIDKPTRNLSKRVNHGANYNMGWAVLIDTMGLEAIFEAKRILKLSPKFTAKDTAQFLLARYEKAYPRVKGVWYDEIKYAVESTKLLVSSLGWTRYCFGKPTKSKPDLNAYVAHVPQNLSVQIINKGFYKALEFQRKNWPNFRLKAQIHDSTPFQYKEGREDLCHEYAKLLDYPVKIKGRIMRIPVGLKLGGKRWSEIA